MRHIDKEAFGKRVARRRTAMNNMSAADLASRVGMKQQGIASIEAGIVKRPRFLREIARELRTTEDWLLWEMGPEVVEVEAATAFVHVPLISWVSAGKMAAALAPGDVPLLAFADLGRGDFFALRVQGDSMDRISPEDSVIVINRADKQLVTGRFYVFARRGEATYKRWHADPDYLAPYSTNPTNEPILVSNKREFEVVGRVRRTVLDL